MFILIIDHHYLTMEVEPVSGGDEGFADSGEVNDDEAMEIANVNNESDGKYHVSFHKAQKAY